MNLSDLTLIVAAGGKSTRMGQDKRFLPLDGESLLARTLRKGRAAGVPVPVRYRKRAYLPKGRVTTPSLLPTDLLQSPPQAPAQGFHP